MEEEQKEYIVDTIEYYQYLKDTGEGRLIDTIYVKVGFIILTANIFLTTFDTPISITSTPLKLILCALGTFSFCAGFGNTIISLITKLKFPQEKNEILEELKYHEENDYNDNSEIIHEIYDAMKNDDEYSLDKILSEVQNSQEEEKDYTL